MLGDLNYAILLPAVTARTTTATGSANDTSSWSNNPEQVVAILDVGTITGTQGTLDVTVQESDTTNGTYTTIGTFTQVTTTTGGQMIHCALSKRYVRAVGTTGGTTPSAVYGVHLIGRKRLV